MAVLGVIYLTYKTLIWDLKMGGGIGRAAVLRGTTVTSSYDSLRVAELELGSRVNFQLIGYIG